MVACFAFLPPIFAFRMTTATLISNAVIGSFAFNENAFFFFLFVSFNTIQGKPYVEDITMITICHVHPAHWSRLGGLSLIRHPVESEAVEG